MARKRKIRRTYQVENIKVIDMTESGLGVVKTESKVIFVENAVTGDIVDIEVYAMLKGVPQARIVEFHKYSNKRKEADCQHFDACGGCKWQHIQYGAQLEFKNDFVQNALKRIGKIEIDEVYPILSSPSEYFYRNKLEFTFSNKRWLTNSEIASEQEFSRNALGFHVPKFFDKVVNIERCLLQNELVNEIRNFIREFAEEREWTFYDIKAQTGFLRNLIFRTGNAFDELMLILTVGEEDLEKIDQLFQALEQKFVQITSLIWIYNPKKNDSIYDLAPRVWKGEEFIREKIGEFTFKIRPASFFQTNPLQVQNLYEIVKSWLPVQSKLIYDLYCGTGSIGIFVSDKADKVVGIETVPSAVFDAKKNAEVNGIENISFVLGEAERVFDDELIEKYGKPDTIIVDPPRAGLHKKVVQQILKLSPKYFIYVSCNAATQARDLEMMSEKYHFLKSQAVDMFPQTSHVENVVLAQLKS